MFELYHAVQGRVYTFLELDEILEEMGTMSLHENNVTNDAKGYRDSMELQRLQYTEKNTFKKIIVRFTPVQLSESYDCFSATKIKVESVTVK